jgi:AGCS family alanine or glycine:cation symporter
METLLGDFEAFLNAGNDLLWSYVLIFLLLGAGAIFTLVSRGVQVRAFGHMFHLVRNSRGGANGGITSFQALTTSLAARVGTGNMAGVAMALYIGGPGAIFWMWMTAILGMATSFVESTLAQTYKVSHHDKTFRGGPAYYIEKGLGQRWLGIVFAICLMIAFGLAFNGAQANTISGALNTAFGIDTWMVGVGLVAISAPVIFGGLRSVARTAEILVPVMALLYLAVALVVVIMHVDQLPAVFSAIFSQAFSAQNVAGGVAGYAVAEAIKNGIQRGLFSNEAGMGSAPNAAATATTEPNHPAAQGYVQMLGVFIDTLVICTATAAIILVSGMLEPGSELKGIELTQAALVASVGEWGAVFIAVAIFLFAFTSLIANYSYGEANLEYITGNRTGLMLFRLLVLGMIMAGAVADLDLIWNFANLSMGMMALINLIAILLLMPIAMKLLKDYESQRKAGTLPEFDRHQFPELKDKLDPEAWK